MRDSLRPADSARSAETTQHRRPTSKDILAGGYNCQREIPEPVECEFCGRKLYQEALVMGRTVLMFAPFPQRCTCDRAKAKWAEADAEEARQKAEAEKEAAQAKRRAKIERLLGRSGIKKRFQQRTFANFIRDTPERRRCYDTAKTYADSFPQRAERGEGLYIEGTYGTGKTHLAAAIALQLIGCGVPVVCKTSGDLLADIKEAFDSGDATEYEILKAYKAVDLRQGEPVRCGDLNFAIRGQHAQVHIFDGFSDDGDAKPVDGALHGNPLFQWRCPYYEAPAEQKQVPVFVLSFFLKARYNSSTSFADRKEKSPWNKEASA